MVLSNHSIDHPGSGVHIEAEDALRVLRGADARDELELAILELNPAELRAALMLAVTEGV